MVTDGQSPRYIHRPHHSGLSAARPAGAMLSFGHGRRRGAHAAMLLEKAHCGGAAMIFTTQTLLSGLEVRTTTDVTDADIRRQLDDVDHDVVLAGGLDFLQAVRLKF